MQDRRASQRRLSSGERADQAPTVLQINDLPDVLLLEVSWSITIVAAQAAQSRRRLRSQPPNTHT